MIVARDLTLTLGGRTILDRVSFTIARGESIALVGPNGCGTTSLLRCLLGFVPFAGRLSVGGHDVAARPVAARALMGYVAQQPAFDDVRAIDVMRFVASVRRVDPTRIVAMLSLVRLGARAEERVRTLSSGMRQRLAIAAALLANPPVLLFDQPTAHLDCEGQRLFHDLALHLRREGRTLMIASHRAEEVAALTDRALHLDGGRLPAAAAPRRRASSTSAAGRRRDEGAFRSSARPRRRLREAPARVRSVRRSQHRGRSRHRSSCTPAPRPIGP